MAPASIRYKNPGAMWGSPLAKKWGATDTVKLNDGTGQGNNIAVFPTYVQGICAQLDLWRSSPRYRNKPFKEAIRVWSGGNYVESYIAFVLKRVPGMTRDTVMDDAFWRGPMAIPFLKAQAWHEAGKPYPAIETDWIEARDIVMGKRKKPAAPEPPKPAVKSKTIWASIGAFLTTAATAVSDAAGSWQFWAAIVVLALIAYIVWERAKRPDIFGIFRNVDSDGPAKPAKKRVRARVKRA